MSAGPIVHIGYHKTASTWFQKSFYPHVCNGAYVPRRTVREAFLDRTAFAFDSEEAARLIREASGGKRALLCEEGLSGYLHNGGLAGYLSKEMVFRLRAALPDAQIVIMIRSQPQLIAAAYKQYVKGGGNYSVARYLFPARFLTGANAENPKAPRFCFDHFEYDRLIALYRDQFGPENVHVFLYEAFRRDQCGFLKRFCERLGLEVDLAAVSVRPVYRSYNWAAMYVSRTLGLLTSRTVLDKHWLVHIPFCYPATRGICEGLSRLPLPAPRAPGLFGRRLLAWIEGRFAASNRRLAAMLDLPLADYGYPMAADPPAAEPPLRRLLPDWTHI